ncbi:hypothetical protein ACOSQ4_021145 [Xanthoceras sorbifolium]
MKHKAQLTLELVNEYFQLPNFPEPVDGWVEHEFFQLHNWDLAGSLRADEGSRRWVYQDQELLHSELKVEMAWWYIFCCHSILPKLYRTTLTLLVAKTLFSI